MSEEIRHSYSSGNLGTPNITKPKASLMSSKVNLDSDDYVNDYSEDSSYLAVEIKNGRAKKPEGESEPYAQASKFRKERSTITPSRSGVRNHLKPLKFTPEAFQQPRTEEQDNLIVNLEDIVREEHIIFRIQELIKNKLSIESLCKEWWTLMKTSSVKEMQLFFEEDDSRKLIR